jgi:hypothetical protein
MTPGSAKRTSVGRRRRFTIWLAVLAAVWLFANWPRDGGSLKRFLQWAGCPWTFAFWQNGRLEWFDPAMLAADAAVGAAIVLPVAWLCTWPQSISNLPAAGAKPDPS